MFRKTLSLLIVVFMLLLQFGSLCYAEIDFGGTEAPASCRLSKTDKLNEQAKGGHADSDKVRIIVQFEESPAITVGKKEKNDYTRKLLSSQEKASQKIVQLIGHELSDLCNFTLLFNGIAFDGTAADIDTINGINGMRAFASPEFQLIEPCMSSSSQIVGAPEAWDIDYTGKGMTIAIVDTGILATHEAFSVTPPDAKYDMETMSAKIEEVGENLHASEDIDGVYKNGKIPFAYNYVSMDSIVAHTYSDHGTHVAGIAAGNNGSDFHGIAYDAQLIVMNVFKTTGGADWDVILTALEDCATLGVDSVNMSLGAACGSSSYADESIENTFTMLSEAGVLVAAASGNDKDTSAGNRWGGFQLTENPDMGLTSSPATYYPSLSVASSDNRPLKTGLIKAYGITIDYYEPISGADSFLTLLGEHEFYDCGIGTYEEIPDDVAGEIALIQRGEMTFSEKAQNAYAKGAVGVIVYNNQPGPMSGISVSSDIPFIALSDSDGEFLLLHAENGIGTLEIFETDNIQGDEISRFSSRGTTSDLKIKPEITAPGGSIISSVGSGNKYYGEKSGTSMATPHVAGGMVLIKEYVKNMMPDLSDTELTEVVNSVLMSSANIIPSELVSAQGAGVMNLAAAVSSNSYLTVGGNRPKIELDESEDGKWSFTLTVNNFSNKTLTYSVDYKYMIRKTLEKPFEGDTLLFLSDEAMSVKSLVKTTGESSVTVQAGKSVTLDFDLDASEVINTYGANFPNGTLLEGYVVLTCNSEKLSAPLLGFLGDWDKASMFDRGYYWQLITGETNLQSNGSNVCTYNYAGTQRNNQNSPLAFNPFMSMQDKFNPDWAAISPDYDGTCDSVNTLRFGVLRNAKEFSIDIVTPNEVINRYTADMYDFAKDYLGSTGYTYTSYDLNYYGEGLEEGETAYITLTATLDHEGFSVEDNECAQWVIPVTLDTTAPIVYLDEGRIAVYDEHYVSCSVIYDGEERINILSSSAYFPDSRGEVQYIDGQSGIVYLFVGDYAGNTAFYKINTDTCEIERLEIETNEHTIIYKVSGSIYYMERLHTGDPIVQPENPIRTGYTFTGWDKDIPAFMPDNDIIVNAVFEINKYTVTFLDMDGVTVINTQTVEYGNSAQAPTPPLHEGYTFSEWDKEFSFISSDLTVTAIYTINKYTVTFYDMDRTTVLDKQSIEYGKAAQAPTPPEHEGYTFSGWNVDFSFIKSNLDVCALYTQNTYMVTFYDMDMKTVLSQQTVKHGEAAKAPDAPVHEGWAFECWSEDFSCITDNLDVYAVYSKSILLGDVNGNGNINTADAVLILKYAAEMVVLDCTSFTAADVNHDDKVNTSDAVMILRYAAGIIMEF